MAENSPMTALIGDTQKGLLKEGLRNERVLSCIVEAKVKVKAGSAGISTIISRGVNL